MICSDALQLNHIKPGLKWVIQIVPITYDYLGWFQIVYASIDLYTFPSASQKEWSSCCNHGRSTPQLPTGSFSDCSCSSSVVVILGSQIAVPGLAPWELEKLEIWGCQWMPPTVHPTDILWAIWWYIKGVYDLPNWILAILWVYMTYPTDIWNFQLAKLLKITAGYIPQIHLRTGIAWKFATSKKMRVQSVPPGCSFDDVFLHHFHVSNFFDSYGSYVLSISLLRVVLSIIQMRELPKMTWSSQTWCGECLVDVQYTQKIAHQNISWKFHIIPSFKDPWIHVFHLHLKILYFIHDSENTMIPVTHQWLSNIPRYPKWSLRHPYSEHQPPKSLASGFLFRSVEWGWALRQAFCFCWHPFL